jgi:hypothetical protein
MPAPPIPLEADAGAGTSVCDAPAITNGGASNVKLTKVAHDGSADRSVSTVLDTVPDSWHCSHFHSSRHERPSMSDDATAGREAFISALLTPVQPDDWAVIPIPLQLAENAAPPPKTRALSRKVPVGLAASVSAETD